MSGNDRCVRAKRVGRRREEDYRAPWVSQVLGTPEDLAKARELLNKILLGNVSIPDAYLSLADIYMEMFRQSNSAKGKIDALQATQKLVDRVSEALGYDFDPYQSQITIPLALMTKKMDPVVEFQYRLDKTFQGCIAALSDSEGWNDKPSFRILARVLACLQGLEKEAEIAASYQFYIVNVNLRKPERRDGGQAAFEEHAVAEKTYGAR
jgi:hypothetical protein